MDEKKSDQALAQLTEYVNAIARMEPDIPEDKFKGGVALASIAISLKRIADSMDGIAGGTNAWGETGFAAIARAVTDNLRRY